MAFRIEKPELNLRSKLTELDFNTLPYQKVNPGGIIQQKYYYSESGGGRRYVVLAVAIMLLAALPFSPLVSFRSSQHIDTETASYDSNLPTKDTDNDGIPDYLDNDSDNDGCFDVIEARNISRYEKHLNNPF